MKSADRPVVIVGAGMAGLSCALHLKEQGREVLVLEAAGRVGGRVATDEIEGFLVERGFQVYLDAYPQAGKLLDLQALDLRSFEPGALVWQGGRLHRMMDVFRRPGALLETAFCPVGSPADKLRVGWMRADIQRRSLEQIQQAPAQTTEAYLRGRGFSEAMIAGFFRAFYGGIFLERELRTSSRMFEFTFKMFASGSATVPAGGMGEIPRQLAARIKHDELRLHAPVRAVSAHQVVLDDGTRIEAAEVVVATDPTVAAAWLPDLQPRLPAWRGEWALAFAAEAFPLQEPLIALNGSGEGLINNVCNLRAVSPDCSPDGRDLILVTVLGEPDPEGLAARVSTELTSWFGPLKGLKLLSCECIPRALPEQGPEVELPGFWKSESGVWVTGDHCQSASIEGAVVSGAKVAEAIASR